MNRNLIVETNGYSLLQRLRNGLQCLDEEIEKLETITKDLNVNNLPQSYFQQQTLLLNNFDEILIEVQELKTEIDEKINLDSHENRLLKLRERLLRFEENDKLLSKNYQPFRPKDFMSETENETTNDELSTDDQSIQSFDEDDHNDRMAKCFQKQLDLDDTLVSESSEYADNCDRKNIPIITQENNLDISTDNDCSFNLLSTVRKTAAMSAQKQLKNSVKKSAKKKSSKIDLSKSNNPMAARAFAIYNRWMPADEDNDNDDDSIIKDQNSMSNQHENLITESIEKKNLFKINDDPIKSSGNKKHRIMTPRNRREKIEKVENFRDDYETVEFTPGMTTKVRKSTEK